jgi:hypothetical protein
LKKLQKNKGASARLKGNNKKKRMTVICHGLTNKVMMITDGQYQKLASRPCKNKVKLGCFCHLHKYQMIEFYINPDDSWPRPFELKAVWKIDTASLLITTLDDRACYVRSLYTNSIYEIRKHYLHSCEFIKYNNEICYNDVKAQELVAYIIKDLTPFKFLGDYLLDFKKKCLKSYRHECQKKLIHFYMNYEEGLNRDVVEHIMSFY